MEKFKEFTDNEIETLIKILFMNKDTGYHNSWYLNFNDREYCERLLDELIDERKERKNK